MPLLTIFLKLFYRACFGLSWWISERIFALFTRRKYAKLYGQEVADYWYKTVHTKGFEDQVTPLVEGIVRKQTRNFEERGIEVTEAMQDEIRANVYRSLKND